MILLEKVNIEWLTQVSAKNNKADKILVEKVIRALLLLEGLVQTNVPFVFKGGTALMLILGNTKRLSIDIDIILPEKSEPEEAFSKIIKNKGFTRLELQERSVSSNIEKAHYKFFYEPTYRTAQSEEYVLLDILYEKHQYQKVETIPIESSFVPLEGASLTVTVPSIDGILGDKLTAFAPNTTGIPYEKGGQIRSMEIIKQLYDISCLFDRANSLEIISQTFTLFALTELGYRQAGTDVAVVLDDIYQTALLICTRGQDGQGDFEKLMRGISQIKHFIFSESYNIEKAVTDASKAAYLAKLIEHKATDFSKFNNPLQVKDWTIEQPFNTRLNKLKKSNSEAFFYWYKIFELTASK